MSLERQAGGEPRSRWRRQALALSALGLGIATVVLSATLLLSASGEPTSVPDFRWLLPPAILTVLLAVLSLLRREGSYALPAAAFCLAGAALVLGWIVVVALVALGTALAIAVLSQLL